VNVHGRDIYEQQRQLDAVQGPVSVSKRVMLGTCVDSHMNTSATSMKCPFTLNRLHLYRGL